MYPKFVAGGNAHGYDPAVLEKIWKDWTAFASYAFNKSHATCYSWVAYQTAYLKANFPAQYMAARHESLHRPTLPTSPNFSMSARRCD